MVLSLCEHGPLAIPLQSPRPCLPSLLQQPLACLILFPEWAALLQLWVASPPVIAALDPARPHTPASLSQALLLALQRLVQLAGGWATRAPHRRHAYDSKEIRLFRRQLAALHSLQCLLRSAPSPAPGSWPHRWCLLLDRLQSLSVALSSSSPSVLLSACRQEASRIQHQLGLAVQVMRRERSARWQELLPRLWRDRPAVVYHWLHAAGAPWGTTPIMDAAGLECVTPAAVDVSVRGYWVDTVLRQHAGLDEDSRWATFLASRFGPCIPTAQ